METQLILYKKMLDKAKDVIMLFDEETKIVYANNEAVKCYGYSKEELLGMKSLDLRGQQEPELLNDQFAIALAEGIEVEATHFKKDHSKFPVEVKATGIELDHKKFVLSVVRDITRRKAKEKHIRDLANIVRSSHDGVIGFDLNGIIKTWNNAAETIYGYSKKEVRGKHISQIVIDEENNTKSLLDIIKNDEDIALSRRLRQRKDGSSIYVSVHLSPVKDMEGNIIGVSAFSRDVTDIVYKEQELEEKNEELTALNEELTANEEELRSNYIQLENISRKAEKANLAKNQFLANISHELRTPMNGIIGIAELMGYTDLNSEQVEYVQILKASSEHLLGIISDLLDISKIEAGKLEFSHARFNFRHNIEKLVRQLSFRAKNKGLEIMCSIDPLIAYEYVGDKLRFNQVLINLINNAIKFTEKGYIYIHAKRIEESKNITKIGVEVEDTGIGIPDFFQEDVFTIFSQADNSNTRKFGGAGLGLAISKNIVERMGGEIGFESNGVNGSTFYFTVVLSKVEAKSIKKNENQASLAGSGKNKKILVGEDNEINKKIVSGYLRNLKYQYKVVGNGQEVINALVNEEYDLILMDIQMPLLNGIEATDMIRKDEEITGRHIPIIAMTAHAMAGDKENLLSQGMDDYIPKPFDLTTLTGILSKYTQ